MFKECISSTQFSGATADACFPRIKDLGATYAGDVSLISTVRALLAPRMGEEDELSVYISDRRPNRSVIDGSIDDMFKSILPSMVYDDASNKFIVIDACLNDVEKNNTIMGKIRRNFAKKFPGFEENAKAKLFFGETFPSATFVNPEIKTTIMFVVGLSFERLHYLQCAIAVAIPWYLDVSEGITADEKALIQSLADTSGDGANKYKTALNKMALLYDFRSSKISQFLTGFETFYERKCIDQLKRDIENLQAEIDSLYARIGENMGQQRDNQYKLYGFETKLKDGEGSGIRDYFLSNKNLILEEVRGGIMYFGVKGYLSMFDTDLAERTIANSNSFVYTRNHKFSNADIKKLMTAIFVDRELRVKTCAKFSLDIERFKVEALMGKEYDEPEYLNCMPNPHLHHHGCMNANRNAVVSALKAGNYIGAIEQCCYSASNIAWGDTIVMNKFVGAISGDYAYGDDRYIELPDGTMVNPKEAIDWINSRESEAE